MSKYELNWYGDEVEEDTIEAAKQALLQSAMHLQGESIQEAPVETGDLRGNCAIDDSKLDSDKEVYVGYSLRYAKRQHESLDFSHPRGGKAKFLEDPYNRNIDNYNNNIANAVDEVTK